MSDGGLVPDKGRTGFAATFASLKFFNFKLWFSAATVSSIGSWVQIAGQTWLVMAVLTHGPMSGLAGGVVNALGCLPALFLSAWAGLLADRMDRRKLLMMTQGSMGVFAIGLGVLTLTHVVNIWLVFVFALLQGSANIVNTPVQTIYVGEMVPRRHLANAVGLNSFSGNLARIAGPAIGGFLINWVGCGWTFVINGLSFGATVIVMLLMRTGELHQLPHVAHERGQIREGLRFIRHRTDIIVILVILAAAQCFGFNNVFTQAQMSIRVFHKSAGQFGLLGSVFAAGAAVGALLAARRQFPRIRLIAGGALAYGVVAGVYGFMPNYVSFVVVSATVGAAMMLVLTPANTAIQLRTEPAMRGRVVSIYQIVQQGAAFAGSLIVGGIAGIGGQTGPRGAILVGSLACLVIAVWAFGWTRKHWDVHVAVDHFLPPHVRFDYPGDGEGQPPR